jgi:hypothetical protein
LVGVGHGREDNAELGDVIRVYPHPIKPIGDVDLDEVDRAIPWVGIVDGFQEALQCMTELHCLKRGEPECVGIDTIECVVDDDSGASVALWHDTEGAEAKVWDVFYQCIRQQNPLTPLHHVEKLGLEKIEILDGGLVGPPGEGGFQARARPRRGSERD